MPKVFGPFHTAGDWSLLTQFQKDFWLVPDLIPLSGLVVLASAPKAGKTCFATALARAVATGTDFLGKPVVQGPVFWCSHEELLQERIPLHEGLQMEDEFYFAEPDALPALDRYGITLDNHRLRKNARAEDEYVFSWAVEAGAKLVVVDCLHAACKRTNLADNQAARRIMWQLRHWSHQYHIAVLVLHHLTKSGSRGHQPDRCADSAQILATASTHFILDIHHCPNGNRLLTLHGEGRHPRPPRRQVIKSTGILQYERLDGTQDSEARSQGTRFQLLHLLENGAEPTAEEAAAQLGLNVNTVRNVLTLLQASGEVERANSAAKRTRYRLAEKRPDSTETLRGARDDDISAI